MQTIKNFFKTEGAKLKQMNFTEKRQYIWEYYKLLFGLMLILIIVVYSLLDALVLNPAKDSVITVAWMAEREVNETYTELQDALIPNLVTYPEKETVNVYDFAITGDAEFDMAKTQQFAAMLGAGELDLFVLNGWTSVEEMALAEYVADIDGVMSYLETADGLLYEKISPTLVHGEFTSVPNEIQTEIKTVSGVFAIPIKDTAYVTGRQFNSDDLYLCVSATAAPETYGNIVKAIQVLFKE